MADVERRAFDARIGLSALCKSADVSRTVAYRWMREKKITPSLPTIGKLEHALERLEKAK